MHFTAGSLVFRPETLNQSDLSADGGHWVCSRNTLRGNLSMAAELGEFRPESAMESQPSAPTANWVCGPQRLPERPQRRRSELGDGPHQPRQVLASASGELELFSAPVAIAGSASGAGGGTGRVAAATTLCQERPQRRLGVTAASFAGLASAPGGSRTGCPNQLRRIPDDLGAGGEPSAGPLRRN